MSRCERPSLCSFGDRNPCTPCYWHMYDDQSPENLRRWLEMLSKAGYFTTDTAGSN